MRKIRKSIKATKKVTKVTKVTKATKEVVSPKTKTTLRGIATAKLHCEVITEKGFKACKEAMIAHKLPGLPGKDVKSFNGWLNEGRRVIKGQKAFFQRYFHINQTEAITK